MRTKKWAGLAVMVLLSAACVVGTAQPPAQGKGGQPGQPGRPGGRGGFGGQPGGRGFGGGGATGQILPGFLAEQLKLTDEQKKAVEDLQKEVDGKLAKILTEEQNTQLKEIRSRGFGGRGFGAPGAGGRPGAEGGRPGRPGGEGGRPPAEGGRPGRPGRPGGEGGRPPVEGGRPPIRD